MRRHDRRFDPFAESTVDGIVAGSVTIKVGSGAYNTGWERYGEEQRHDGGKRRE